MPHTPLILLVEDDDICARVTTEKLKKHFGDSIIVQRVKSLFETRNFILDTTTSRPDVILLDLMLSDSQGLATITGVKSIAADIPIVAVTGSCDCEMAARATGADKYVDKQQLETLPIKVVEAIEDGRKRRSGTQQLNQKLEAHAAFNRLVDGKLTNIEARLKKQEEIEFGNPEQQVPSQIQEVAEMKTNLKLFNGVAWAGLIAGVTAFVGGVVTTWGGAMKRFFFPPVLVVVMLITGCQPADEPIDLYRAKARAAAALVFSPRAKVDVPAPTPPTPPRPEPTPTPKPAPAPKPRAAEEESPVEKVEPVAEKPRAQLLFFTFPDCAHCQPVKRALRDLIQFHGWTVGETGDIRTIDIYESAENRKLAEHHGVSLYPTLIVLSVNGSTTKEDRCVVGDAFHGDSAKLENWLNESASANWRHGK